ncbi:Metalloprotease [Hysterangium stoloniferum]|nr:Metalloprotease [Hysterangium stoloniferum]
MATPPASQFAAREDEESAPLLREPAHHNHPGSGSQFSKLVQEPLTPLTKVLLTSVLGLIISTSVFVGLFIGVEHRLSTIDIDPPTRNHTVTRTATNVYTTTAVVTVQPPEPTPDPREHLCSEPHCVTLAASILNSLDTEVDPCEDFYKFTNGNWLRSNPLPADKGRYTSFDEVTVKNMGTLEAIFTDSSTSYSLVDTQTVHKLQSFYQSCLNETHTNSLGIQPLLEIVDVLKRLFNGSSTIVDSAQSGQHFFKLDSELNAGLTAAVAFLHSRGVNALFQVDVEGDVGVDPNAMTLWFNQPELGLPSKEYYDEASIREVYISTLTRIFTVLNDETVTTAGRPPKGGRRRWPPSGGRRRWPPYPWPPWGGHDDDHDDDDKKPEPKKSPKELADAVVQFERQIANASLDLDRMQQDPVGTYNRIAFANFTASIPQLDIPAYMSTFAPRAFPDNVIVTYPPYFKSLSSLLSDTTDEIIEAYLISRLSGSLAQYLGPETEIWKANRELTEALTGIKKGAIGDRASYCTKVVAEALGFAAGRFFVQETFGGDSQSKARHVIENIIEAFKRSLKNVHWMDGISAEAAAEKASNIRVKVGYPLSPNTTDARSIANYYAKVDVNGSDFFGNVVRTNIFSSTLSWAKLGKGRDLESWQMPPFTVNAYFDPPANEIVFPAGILQPPFFSAEWPKYVVYGAFGHVAAHELTHAFDTSGRFYDQNGKLREWWTNTTSAAFDERSRCISHQYSSYTIDDGQGKHIHVNRRTNGEDIGDSGLVQSYRAWQNQFDASVESGGEYLLPGLNFTREQLFFISFGRIWAENITPEAAIQRIYTDPHSPNQYRVMGTLINTPQFAAAFNCPKGSKLNPPDEARCSLW